MFEKELNIKRGEFKRQSGDTLWHKNKCGGKFFQILIDKFFLFLHFFEKQNISSNYLLTLWVQHKTKQNLFSHSFVLWGLQWDNLNKIIFYTMFIVAFACTVHWRPRAHISMMYQKISSHKMDLHLSHWICKLVCSV